MSLTDDQKRVIIEARQRETLMWTQRQLETKNLWLIVRDGTFGQTILNWIEQFSWLVLSDASGNVHHDEFWLADDSKWNLIKNQMIYTPGLLWERLSRFQSSLNSPNDLQSRFHILTRVEGGVPLRDGWMLDSVGARLLPTFNTVNVDRMRILRVCLGFGGTFKGEELITYPEGT